ncbi:MAG: DegT/DnrJ/EryC1/StrS family aminotransferase [Candidatus Heimdallarchaeota archaeon]|nr:DegT/DnrJ/EryC1/StrS family aminotransferase [Candidatus Heimdallarchaeota archaeon]MDH5646313.1 DegT/DnrJ/EryC1/StrS family aminotransferase [Candidatus Heimdallarchaeota archaeon]
MARDIPFVDPHIGDEEVQAVSDVIRSGKLVEGEKTRSFEQKFAKFTETKHAIACVNGTAALHLAMEASPLQPGDEVITTPFTFIATSNSILFTGAVPKFVDIDKDTWNLNSELVEQAITPKTKAIMPVHIFGLPADMKAFKDIAEDNDLFLIEDAAQAHGARIDGTHVGGFGDLATFSLYVSKNLISGEGGIITTNNDELAENIISLKNHGRTPKGGYEHIQVGYNYRMYDVTGAIADIQMNKIDNLLERRKETAKQYRKIIDEIPNLGYQQIPNGMTHGNYIFAVDTRDHEIKPEEAVKKFREKGIMTRPIYSKLSYQQVNFKNIGNWRWAKFVDYPDYNTDNCILAEQIAVNHFEIPVVPSLNKEEIEKVKSAVSEIFT